MPVIWASLLSVHEAGDGQSVTWSPTLRADLFYLKTEIHARKLRCTPKQSRANQAPRRSYDAFPCVIHDDTDTLLDFNL